MKFSASTNFTFPDRKHFHHLQAIRLLSLSLSLSRARVSQSRGGAPLHLVIPALLSTFTFSRERRELQQVSRASLRTWRITLSRGSVASEKKELDKTVGAVREKKKKRPQRQWNGHFRSFSNLYFLPWLLESKCCPEQAQVLCQESSHFVLQNFSLNGP